MAERCYESLDATLVPGLQLQKLNKYKQRRRYGAPHIRRVSAG